MEPTLPTTDAAAEPPLFRIKGDLAPGAEPVTTEGDILIEGHIGRGAQVEAGGNVMVGGDIDGAKIVCRGMLDAPRSAVNGGRIIAYGGVICRTLGAPGETPTYVGVGIDDVSAQSASKKLAGIESIVSRVQGLEQRMAPMMQAGATLTPAAREQLSEYLYIAVDARKRAEKALEQLHQQLERIDAHAVTECHVKGMIYGNVTLEFPGSRTCIDTPIKGPCRIIYSRGDFGVQIEVVEEQSGQRRKLDLTTTPSRIEPLRRLLQQLKVA